jgi:hypothetical protein
MIRLVKQEQHIQLVDIIDDDHTTRYIDCSFKFIMKVGVEESIVNAPLVSLQSKNQENSNSSLLGKNTNNAKSEVILLLTADP